MSYQTAFHHKFTGHAETKPVVPTVDAHLHFVDFLQGSKGVKKLLASMDKGGITKAVLFGLPVKKKWESIEKKAPHYYLDDNAPCYYFSATDQIVADAMLSIPPESLKRFAPLVCGFNPTDRFAAREIEQTLSKYPFWRGVGEILCRHDDLTNITQEETARVNHPALLDVYELCASRNLPVLIHQNSTSVGIHEEYEHLHELEEVLQDFPGTTFVWAHCGISRRVFHKRYHEMVSAMLKRFPNLHMDISWVVYDDIICKSLEPHKHWLEVIQQNPTRFSIGSDLCGDFETLGANLARYNHLLRVLSPKIRKHVASGNAEKMWFTRRIQLPEPADAHDRP